MPVEDWIGVSLILAGVLFYAAGSIGVLRFGDLHSRLHAVTKADNLGLGLVAAGVAVSERSPAIAAKLVAIWLLAVAAAATATFLLAQRAAAGGDRDG